MTYGREPSCMGIITGWRAIAQTFGVPQSVARSWREQGAPILLLPGGKKETVPAANVPELWAWLSGRYGPAASSPAKKEAHPFPVPSSPAASEPPTPAHHSAAPDMPHLRDHGHGAPLPGPLALRVVSHHSCRGRLTASVPVRKVRGHSKLCPFATIIFP